MKYRGVHIRPTAAGPFNECNLLTLTLTKYFNVYNFVSPSSLSTVNLPLIADDAYVVSGWLFDEVLLFNSRLFISFSVSISF